MSFISGMASEVASFFGGGAAAAEQPLSGVELCRVPAFHMGQPLYQGLKMLGLDASHQWLRGPGFEAGMGRDPDSANPLKVAWTDHHARSEKDAAAGNRVCTPVEQENPAFAGVHAEDVARHARPGAKIDPWYKLLWDNCQTTARDAVVQAQLERLSRCEMPASPATPEPTMSMAAEPQALQSLFGGYT